MGGALLFGGAYVVMGANDASSAHRGPCPRPPWSYQRLRAYRPERREAISVAHRSDRAT
jgi:hypothetical protein